MKDSNPVRARNVYNNMIEDGFNPAEHTDAECLKYRNLGKRSLPFLRELSKKNKAVPKQTDGGPAFPVKWQNGEQQSGMTLRDWFAGQALVGYVAYNPDSRDVDLACVSYATADAMLAEREKGGAE